MKSTSKQLEPLPYFKWLWRDWRANRHVQRLHYVAKGLYRELLDEQWCEGFIPANVETLADICGCPVPIMQEYWPSLKDLFEEQEDGSLVNRKLEQQRTTEDSIRAAKARGGKKSALSKINKINKPSRGVEDLLESSSDDLKTSHIAEQSRAEQSISEQEPENSFCKNDGQGDEVKTERSINLITEQFFGKRAFLRGRNGEDLKRLVLLHKGSSVERAYGEWCQANQDNPDIKDPLAVFLEEADDILGAETPAKAAFKDSEVVSLARELAYASGGQISFMDKQKIRLAEVLKDFTAEEITTCFKSWLEDQDLTDPKNLQFLPGKFVQIVDSRAYALRRFRIERAQTEKDREIAVQRLQEEAEINRQAREKIKQEEESAFDPFSMI